MSQYRNKDFLIDYIKAINPFIKGLYLTLCFKILKFKINFYFNI